jgi:histidine triad (HIT) family protein
MTDRATGVGAAERPDEEAEACVFCAIAAGTVPAEVVAESPLSLAFRDIEPVARVHVLVIPRRHIKDAAAVGSGDGEQIADLYRLARDVAEREGVLASGYRLVANVGPDANNSVAHLHLHLVGGRQMQWPPG